jgi:hypothetical protein
LTFEHVFADLGGIPANRLTDPQGLAGLLLAAANAAGLNPASFADLAGMSGALPQRGLDVIIKRLGAREVRTDVRRRGPVTQAIHPEGS